MNHKKISVILPCFNEEKTIRKNLEHIYAYLKKNFSSFEIIAVNDGSSDNTREELEKSAVVLPIRIVDNWINGGKGKAVRDGVLASREESEIVMFLDADLAIPIEELEKFLLSIDNGVDLAIASRLVPGLKVKKPVAWYRKIMELVFVGLRMVIINSYNIRDTQCGFKVFRRKVAMRIFKMATIDRFAFDSEVIFIAKKFGYDIQELPITLQNPRTSHVRIVRDSINMFFALLKIRLNDLTGVYQWKKHV